MLRNRIRDLEEEVRFQDQLIKDRDMKLKEIEEMIMRIKGEVKVPLIATRMEERVAPPQDIANNLEGSAKRPPATARKTPVSQQIRPGEVPVDPSIEKRRSDVRHLFNRAYDEL